MGGDGLRAVPALRIRYGRDAARRTRMSSVTAEPVGRAGPPGPPAGQSAKARTRKDVRRRIGEKAYTPYLFLAPHFLLFAAFILFPFFFGIFISLHDYFGGRAGPFVGLRWY